MVLPDDTPTPGLAEFAAVNAPDPVPARRGDADRHQPPALGVHHRTCGWSRSARSTASVGDRGRARLPADRGRAESDRCGCPTGVLAPVDPDAETWLTVRAELAADAPWAPAGHVVAASSSPVRRPRPAPRSTVDRGAASRATTGSTLGRRFDPRTGSAADAARPRGRRPAAGALAGPDRQRPVGAARVVRAGRPGGHRRRGGARPVLGAALARAWPRPAGARGPCSVTAVDRRRLDRPSRGPGRPAAGCSWTCATAGASRGRARAHGGDHPVDRVGLHLAPGRGAARPAAALDRAGWFGTGPLESYPGLRDAPPGSAASPPASTS